MTDKSIVLLASMRDGEEQMWLDAFDRNDDVQWWIVPRHPQRFAEVEKLLQQAGLTVLRKSQVSGPNNAQVVLGDTMGEMFVYYALADVVIMGGGWQPLGGQNFLEALALGKPTIVGPHMFNFAQITLDALEAGVVAQVDGMRQALAHVHDIAVNDSRQFVLQHQGAVQKTLQRL